MAPRCPCRFVKRQDLYIERMDDIMAEWIPQLVDRVGVIKIDVEVPPACHALPCFVVGGGLVPLRGDPRTHRGAPHILGATTHRAGRITDKEAPSWQTDAWDACAAQGNELSVIQGALNFFHTVRPRYVLAECNDDMMAAATGTNVRHFFQAMDALGYSVHRGSFEGEVVPPATFSNFTEHGIVNFFFTASDQLKQLH